jgi:riboflavin biosynthesis pyrimidine reductase
MFVFSNLAISLDGKIDTKKRSARVLGTSADHREMKRLRGLADAVVIGGATFRSHPVLIPGVLNVIWSRKIKGGPRFRNAKEILSHLKSRGVKRVLVEGGGEVMWEFIKHDLIDEFHVTLTPWIIGGKTAPTLVDGEGFLPGKIRNLRLVSVKKVRDEIFLVYRKR